MLIEAKGLFGAVLAHREAYLDCDAAFTFNLKLVQQLRLFNGSIRAALDKSISKR